jgi:acetylornithine deacetylase/succinyl-diaminopimelate desuccinylase-like protein
MTSRALTPLVVDAGALVALARELVVVPSPSGEELRIAELLAERLDGDGFDVELQEVEPRRPNVVATWTGAEEGPTLVFNGHLDTLPIDPELPRPFDARVEDGYLYGAGSNNMKGAVAAMVGAMRTVAAQPRVPGRIVLTAVVGECDALGLGTSAAIERGLRADACINGEPTELRVLTDHAGVTQLDIVVRGREVHVYERERGVNAIEQAAALLARLHDDILTCEGGLDRLPILNVGTIEGGVWPSLTAAQCRIGVDVRSTGTMTPESIRADVLRLVEELAAADPQLEADVALRSPPRFVQQRPFHIDADAAPVAAVARAHALVTGSEPEVGPHWPESFYGTDASHLLHAGIPTVIYGPGSHTQISRPNERIAVAELVTAATVYATAAAHLLGGSA